MRNAEWSVKSGGAWTLRSADSKTRFNPSVAGGTTGPTMETTTGSKLSATIDVAGVLVGSVAAPQQQDRLAAGT